MSRANFAKQQYIKGHCYKSKAFQEKRGKGIKKAYADGKMAHATHQSPEFIEKRIAPLRGRVVTDPDARAARSAQVRKAWADGKYSGGMVGKLGRRMGATPAQMDEIRKKRDMPKLKATLSEKLKSQVQEWKESGQLDAIRRKAGTLKDMPDHIAARHWVIRDPAGRIHEFDNLCSWSRSNTHLFEDTRPLSKSPFWLRISGGINSLFEAAGRSCSYKGWVGVSTTEIARGGADLLGRCL